MLNRKGGSNQRLAIMLGILTKDKNHPIQANIPKKDRSTFAMTKYKFLLFAPFVISNKCCFVMKKKPAHLYFKQTGKVPITAQMAVESRLRTQKWLQHGCNAFDSKIPTSNPMSFWTENDVLTYIHTYHVEICSVYGDIVPDTSCDKCADGQLRMEEVFSEGCKLRTTGLKRTGCMFCGYGCHLNNDQRFVMMKETHLKLYDWIMKPVSEGGLGYKEVIDWLNENGNLNIKY